MSSSKREYTPLKLDEARRATPPVNPIEAMKQQIAVAVFGAVKEAEVAELVEKLRSMAMAGDLKAAKLYFDLLLPKEQKPAPPPPAEIPGLQQVAEAMRDLVDEIRVTKARSARAELEALPINGTSDGDDE